MYMYVMTVWKHIPDDLKNIGGLLLIFQLGRKHLLESDVIMMKTVYITLLYYCILPGLDTGLDTQSLITAVLCFFLS